MAFFEKVKKYGKNIAKKYGEFEDFREERMKKSLERQKNILEREKKKAAIEKEKFKIEKMRDEMRNYRSKKYGFGNLKPPTF